MSAMKAIVSPALAMEPALAVSTATINRTIAPLAVAILTEFVLATLMAPVLVRQVNAAAQPVSALASAMVVVELATQPVPRPAVVIVMLVIVLPTKQLCNFVRLITE